jgi:RNA-directed DNA polymerase
MLWRWCRRRHPNQPRKWIKDRYFKRFGNRDWVFTGTLKDDKNRSRVTCLQAAARVGIYRQVKIRGEANPYDPEWEGYFDERLYRKMQRSLVGQGRIAYLHSQQGGRCGGCGQPLQEDQDWQIHHRVRRTLGGPDSLDNLELLHANCHRQMHSNHEGDSSDCASREAFAEA